MGLYERVRLMDWLFIIWIIVTLLLFLDFIIPHPLWLISKPFTIGLFLIILGALIVRMIFRGLSDVINIVTHPAVITFVVTLIFLVILNKIPKVKRK